jgi:hypothetical protein
VRALFNAVCDCPCGQLKPRCARVYMRRDGKATQYHGTPTTLCEDCRRLRRGLFRYDDMHAPIFKPVKRVKP